MQFCQTQKNLSIYAYVILENHFHLICQAINLSNILQSLKRHTTKFIVEQLKHDQKDWTLNLLEFYKKRHKRESHHQLWQEGFHPQQMISDDMFRQKVEYIHYNPVKRGYVELPEHWYYSSA
ncbi:MAG: transposase, partial [bacterium]